MPHTITIKANGSEKDYWKELWNNRQLLYILSKRDISVRYKQTLLGVAWSVVRPLLTMMIMVFVFSKVAKLKGDPGIPYPLMVLGGITIWTFFSNSLVQISNSIVINSNLVTKVYFPRLIMPLSAVAVGFIDFLISLGLYMCLSLYYQYPLSPQIVFLPVFVLLTFFASLGFGLFFAVLNVRFRDIGQLIPFLVQVGFYICPIAYSSRLTEGEWFSDLYYLNPIVGIIDGFRWSLLGENAYFNASSLYSSVIVSGIALVFSLIYFRKREKSFVDYI